MFLVSWGRKIKSIMSKDKIVVYSIGKAKVIPLFNEKQLVEVLERAASKFVPIWVQK
jgi:hypothetical protein